MRGPGNLGPPVLLIHGGGPGGIVFDLVALALRWPKIRAGYSACYLVPTLLIYGDRDHWSRPEELAALRAELVNAP